MFKRLSLAQEGIPGQNRFDICRTVMSGEAAGMLEQLERVWGRQVIGPWFDCFLDSTKKGNNGFPQQDFPFKHWECGMFECPTDRAGKHCGFPTQTGELELIV